MTENTTPTLADPVIHECPTNGSSAMPCCGLLPFEVPTTDRITVNTGQVTCGALSAEDWEVWHAIHVSRTTSYYKLQQAANAFAVSLQPYFDAFIKALNGIAGFLDGQATKAQRRQHRKVVRNAAKYSQPWAPGALKKKRSRR